MKVDQVSLLTSSHPTQFEGRTIDDRPVYVRFRDGYLTVDVGLPGESEVGSGYCVYESDVMTAAGNDEITWEEVQAEIASVDLQERINEMEKDEQTFHARWAEAFQGIQKRTLPNLEFWTLKLKSVLWVTPYDNRIGRFDFEWAMCSYCQSGICAYVFDDPTQKLSTITVLPIDECAGRWNPMELAVAGAEAFGGVRFGPSGGSGRGEAEGVRIGDAEEAFGLVLAKLVET